LTLKEFGAKIPSVVHFSWTYSPFLVTSGHVNALNSGNSLQHRSLPLSKNVTSLSLHLCRTPSSQNTLNCLVIRRYATEGEVKKERQKRKSFKKMLQSLPVFLWVECVKVNDF